MRAVIATLATLLALGPATALAEVARPIVVMSHPGAVALALRDRGYRARLGRDGSDRPMITSGSGGLRFDIVFYGCAGDGECRGVLFTSGFDLDGGIGLSEMNAWNSDRLVGRAFVDTECDPFVDHYVTADPLASDAAFDALLADWELALSDFHEFIDFDAEEPRIGVAGCGPGTGAI